MTAWLINPARKGRKKVATKRKPPKGYRSWSAWSKAMQRARKRKATGGRKRTTSTRKTGGRKVAARKRTTTRRKPATRRRRTTKRRRSTGTIRMTPIRGRVYKRNPPIVRTLVDGVKNAAYAVLGKAAARAVPNALSLPQTGVTGIAVQAATAVGVGMVADRVLPRGAGPFVVAGALMAPIESLIVSAGIPVLSPALSGMGSYAEIRRNGVAGYARVGAGPMGSYPNAVNRMSGVGATPLVRPLRTGPGVFSGLGEFDHALMS